MIRHEIIEPLLDDPEANLPEVKNRNFQTVYMTDLKKGKYVHEEEHGDDPWWNSDSDEGRGVSDEGDNENSEDNDEDEE